jgi:NADH dehydrogenase [ubiquinone] 1 alpha subcomplex assembly factor 1
MKNIVLFLSLSIFFGSSMETIYTFSATTNIKEWRIVNDGVMGGISRSSLVLTDAGHGKFSGHVSLANNGGFASIQLDTTIRLGEERKFIVLRLKGDGKRYEFRIKGERSQSESYVQQFATSGEWETIRLSISAFYPQFRGRTLTLPNFNFSNIEQMSFLIANKEEEDFELHVSWIGLE